MKKLALISLLTAVILMAGCVKINVTETIGATGVSDLVMTLEVVNKSASKDDDKDPCVEIRKGWVEKPQKHLTNPTCKYDKTRKILTITASFDRKAAGGLTVTGDTYRFDVKKAMKDMNEKDEKEGDAMKVDSPKDPEQIRKLKESGFEYYYFVKMPGTVTKQVGGKTQLDGSVRFDIVDMPENAYVESSLTPVGALINSVIGDKKTETKKPSSGAKKTDDSSPLSGCCCIPGLTAVLAAMGAMAAKAF